MGIGAFTGRRIVGYLGVRSDVQGRAAVPDRKEGAMTQVNDILRRKGPQVFSVREDATVLDAVRAMNDRHVGSVVVTDAQGGLCGILTERDLLTRVLALGVEPRMTRVSSVMTREVFCCRRDTSLGELRQEIRERRIRHVPVLEPGEGLVGMVSIGDLNAFESEVLAVTVSSLEAYISRA